MPGKAILTCSGMIPSRVREAQTCTGKTLTRVRIIFTWVKASLTQVKYCPDNPGTFLTQVTDYITQAGYILT